MADMTVSLVDGKVETRQSPDMLSQFG